MTKELNIRVEFGGGVEHLFDKKKFIDLSVQQEGEAWTIEKLINHLTQHHLKERPELFASGHNIRPGILILVNDVDYALLGSDDYAIQDKDRVLFISTLHGG